MSAVASCETVGACSDPVNSANHMRACSSTAPCCCCPLHNVALKSIGTVQDGHMSCTQLQRHLTEVLQAGGRNAVDLQSRGWQSRSQACVVRLTLLFLCAWLGSFLWPSWRGPPRAGAVLSWWPRVLGEYWRDHENNSCDGNDFIFATCRISSSTNGLQDHQRFSGRKKGSKPR
jgi:hypothetical protein